MTPRAEFLERGNSGQGEGGNVKGDQNLARCLGKRAWSMQSLFQQNPPVASGGSKLQFGIQRQERRDTVGGRRRVADVAADRASVLNLATADLQGRPLQPVQGLGQGSLGNLGPGCAGTDAQTVRRIEPAQVGQRRQVQNIACNLTSGPGVNVGAASKQAITLRSQHHGFEQFNGAGECSHRLTLFVYILLCCFGSPSVNSVARDKRGGYCKVMDSNEPAYSLDDQIGYLLRRVTQRHLSIFNAAIPQVTTTQFAALAKLAELGPRGQNTLGRATSMDGATIKGVVDRLIRDGLVQTAADPTDGRRLTVSLTEAGATLYAAMLAAAIKVSEQTLAPLSEMERVQLIQLLSRLT